MTAVMLPQQFQFINSSAAAPSHSILGAEKKQRRQPVHEEDRVIDEREMERKYQAKRANSHAAKVAHARRRRFMVLEYLPKGLQQPEKQKEMMERSVLKGFKGNPVTKPSSEQGRDRLMDRASVLELVTNGLLEITRMRVGECGISGPRSVLGAGTLDPFGSFARELSGEEGFLFHHYIRFVIPFQSTHCNRVLPIEAYQHTMIQDFTPLSYSRADTLDSVFLITCRHIVTVLSSPELSPMMRLPEGEKEYYNAMAMRYKVSCIKGLRESITREGGQGGRGWSNETVVCMLMLTSDELWSGDLEMARKHLKGAFQVVRMKGGMGTLGCNGLIEKVMGMSREDSERGPVCQTL